jgi:hypothetical protein
VTDRLDDPPLAEPDADVRVDHDVTSRVGGAPAPAPTDDTSDTDWAHDGDAAIDGDGEADEARPSWFRRAGERAVRRPVRWATAPWPTDRIVKLVVTVLSLGVTTAVMMNVVHLNPFSPAKDLVFDDTTPTGGDFGAHVWGPAFLRDHLLPSWRLNGWSMDWYAGMPAYRFYMVLPALMILAVDVVLPYGVAMKLVGVAGLVTLPAACWAFGRLARFRYPMPELFAFAGLAFALDESFSIYGGNLKSTMAGEFSFSIALSIGMVGLGLLAHGMRTGRFRVWASVLIAAAAVSHGIVAIFVLLAAAVIVLVWIDRTRFVYGATVGLTAMLLSIWWVGPFLLDHAYMTDMKYGFRPQGATDSFWDMFFPLTAPLDILITTLAVVGFAACVMRRHLTGAALGIVALVLVVLVYLTRDSLPVIGLLWNPRLLPFLYLVRYLLMMIGVVEVFTLAWNTVRERRASEVAGVWPSTVFASITGLAVLAIVGWMFQVLPADGTRTSHGEVVYAWGPLRGTSTNADAQGDGWSRYNFLGYEGRGEWYTEYHGVVTTMEQIGLDPSLGCGRALWENNEDNGRYGTTMALMLLPHWTDGCIGSMEGLFFEASGTTPYHFLTTAAMSKQSSNPVRELRYVDNDASVGVPHLQSLGVRYVMVRTPEAKAEAAAQPELSFITSSGPWDIYLVGGADVVQPLAVQPVVVEGRSGDARERNLELGTSWFQHRDEWAAMPADDGPDEWQRISVEVDLTRREGEAGEPGRRVDIVVPTEPIVPVALPAVEVSDVVIDQQSLSFSVDQIGVPVLVKVSYFPNWEASGADGPFRIAPNMMVVVPTANEVTLTYGRTTKDWTFLLLTLVGIGLCVLWRVRGDVRHRAEVPVFGPDPDVVPDDELDEPGPGRGYEGHDGHDGHDRQDDHDDGDAWSRPPADDGSFDESVRFDPADP